MSGTPNPQSRPAASVTPVEVKPKRERRKRSPSKARPVFIVAQVMDEDGNPVAGAKKFLKVLSVELNAEKVLEITEGGDYENAFYVRLVVPPRQAQRPSIASVSEVNSVSPTAA